jgi:hypothetical protein
VPRLPVGFSWLPASVTSVNRAVTTVLSDRFFRHLFTNFFVLAAGAVHKTMLQMLSVQSMLEVFVLTVWAKLTPNCSYVAFLLELYPDVHVLTTEQIQRIKAAGVKYMVPLRVVDPAGSPPQPRVRSCRRRQGTSSSTGWCTCAMASSR